MFIIVRKFIISSALLLCCFSGALAQNEDLVFQAPVPPDNLESLADRSNYIVEHFWDRCNLKSIFSNKNNFETAFDRYIAVIPWADTTVVFNSVDRLIKEVKKNPTNLQIMAKMAKAKLYSDSAEYVLDAVYIPFARAAVNAGGISKEEKDEYNREIKQLEHSQLGNPAPDFTMMTREGEIRTLNSLPSTYMLIFFDDPDDFNNMMARTRLASDYGLNELVNDGLMTVLSLYPGEPDQAWKDRAEGYPANWIVAASADADNLFDRRWTPTCYYLNKDRVIMSKALSAESLIEGFRSFYERHRQNKAERERLRQEVLKNQTAAGQN